MQIIKNTDAFVTGEGFEVIQKSGRINEYFLDRANHTGDNADDSALTGTMNICSAPSTSSFTNSTRYFGSQSGLSPQTSNFYVKCPVPTNMRIIKIAFFINRSGTTPTSEYVKLYFRKNNTNVETLDEEIDLSLNNPVYIFNVNVSMVAGDFWSFEIIYPNWATAPTAVYFTGTIYYEHS